MKEYIIGNKINLRKVELSDKDKIKQLFKIDCNDILYLITLKNDNIIGYVTLLKQNTLFLLPGYQNIEIASNVLRLILNLVFTELKQESISYKIDINNYYLNTLFKKYHFDSDIYNDFIIYTLKKQEYKTKEFKKNKYLTGEDIDMINDRSSISHKNICDNHWDGA